MLNRKKYLDQIKLIDSPTREEINLLHEYLNDFNLAQTNGEYDQPGIEINQIIKDGNGVVVGGVNASTLLRIMHLEVLWVADEYRKYGLASALVLGAERIGAENGCLSTQTMSFSFQAPGFYQKLGYKVVGIYTGYPYGISEYVLNKPLTPPVRSPNKQKVLEFEGLAGQFTIGEEVTEADMQVLHKGLHAHVVENIGDQYKGIAVKLVLKEPSGRLIGGATGYTTINNLILECLWVDEAYRGLGLGRRLLTEAETKAKNEGCIACQTMSLSFQAPGFFQKMGYQVYGVSDSYPEPVIESHFVKFFD